MKKKVGLLLILLLVMPLALSGCIRVVHRDDEFSSGRWGRAYRDTLDGAYYAWDDARTETWGMWDELKDEAYEVREEMQGAAEDVARDLEDEFGAHWGNGDGMMGGIAPIAGETTALSSFSKVRVSIARGLRRSNNTRYSLTVVLRNGEESIAFGEGESLNDIQYTMKEDALHIEYGRLRQDVTVFISAKEFSDVSIQGGVQIISDGTLTGKKLNIDVPGAVNAKLELDYEKKIDVTVSGASKMVLSGKADKLEITSNGASSINAKDLAAREVDVEMRGVGAIVVRAQETLDVQMYGVGTLEYYGNPVISKSAGGIGKITQRSD